MSFIDWLFRDRRTGRIVVGQSPNLALIIVIASSSAAWLLDRTEATEPGLMMTGLRLIAVSSLVWWSIDEVVRGVNPWRRCLGAAALGYALWQAWQLAG